MPRLAGYPHACQAATCKHCQVNRLKLIKGDAGHTTSRRQYSQLPSIQLRQTAICINNIGRTCASSGVSQRDSRLREELLRGSQLL